MSATNLKSVLIQYAHSLGFERVGITSAETLTVSEERLKDWVAEGRAGSMHYMTAGPERRARPQEILPGARSVIALAKTYSKSTETSDAQFDEREGRIARYTTGTDYHRQIMKRLQSFTRYLEALSPESKCRSLVDTGPLLERAFAQKAGLGFVGKNTMLITKGLGSWVFLASVVTTLELEADQPDDRSCGDCRLCVDACPTQAITEPYHLDARLCISYLTIENRGVVADQLKGKVGPWVFGCDVCQEVCPHNSGRTPAPQSMNLRDILALKSADSFGERFSGTSMTRTGFKGMLRNACLASAQLERVDLLPLIDPLTEDEDPALRDSARWAVAQLKTISESSVSRTPH